MTCPKCQGELSMVKPEFDGAECRPCAMVVTHCYLAAGWWDRGVTPDEYAALQRRHWWFA